MKTDLLSLAGITSTTLVRLSKGKSVNIEIIDSIYEALHCQPSDILEHIKETIGEILQLPLDLDPPI